MKRITFCVMTCMLLMFGGITANGYAQTITWMVNGSVHTTTTSTTGTVGTLPTNPTSFNANYPYFEGWFTTPAAMDGAPDETAPAIEVTTTTAVTGDVTFYAVFTNAIDGIALLKATSISNGDIIYLATSDNAEGLGVTGAGYYVNSYQAFRDKRPHTQWIPFVVNGTADSFTLVNTEKGGIAMTSKSFTLGTTPYSQFTFNKDGYFVSQDNLCLMLRGSSAYGYSTTYIGGADSHLFYMYKRTTPGYVSSSCSDGVTVTLTPAEESINLGADGKATTTITCTKTGGTGNGNWSYEVSPSTGTFDGTTFTATAAGTYTVYATYRENCDNVGKTAITVTATPTLYFTEAPANPVIFPTVECGESTALSDKKAVSVQGYNLTGGVVASVSTGYKIALSADAALADYAQSVTLPTDGGKINAANTTIYIIACPPQNSTAPTTGTLTITAAGGNTITANLSTPDITCSGYTLSINNNGAVTTVDTYCAGASVPQPEAPAQIEDCPYTFDGWSTTPVTSGCTSYNKIDFSTYTMPKGNTTIYAVYKKTKGSVITGTETIKSSGFSAPSNNKSINDAVSAKWTWAITTRPYSSYPINNTFNYILLRPQHAMTIAIKDDYKVSSIIAKVQAKYEDFLVSTGATITKNGTTLTLTPMDENIKTITLTAQTVQCNIDSFIISYKKGSVTTYYYSTLNCGYTQKVVTADETMNNFIDQNMDVIVKEGANLTITGTSQLHNLTIEGGAAVALQDNATLTVSGMYLAGGWTTVAGAETYDMPSLYMEDGSTLATDKDSVYLDLTIDKRNYYPFAVPFDAKVSDIRYADAELAQAATYGKHFIVKTYDGATRATTPGADNTWAAVSTDETLTTGTGYIITAVPHKDSTHTVIRIPMAFRNGSTPRNTVTVTAYDNSGKADKHNIGWNYIANPYMTAFHAAQLTGMDTLRYAQVPLYDFSDYKAVLLRETTLRPEWGFFVQVGESGTLNFAAEGQRLNAPMLGNAEDITTYVSIYLNNGSSSLADRFGLVINDRYTTDYEIGADLERMFGNAYTLATYSVMNGVQLAYNALPSDEAQKEIAVGFRAPEAGNYTFTLDPEQDTVGIRSIELYDREADITTNLLLADYTFSVSGPTQSDTRFRLRVVLNRNVPSEVENVAIPANGTGKTIRNGHLYITHDGKVFDATGKVVSR